MTELNEEGHRLLRLLVSLLPAANPERPDKMIGYKDAHERLGLSNVRGDWGASLKAQGLENLAEWTKAKDKPAITGIIVNQQDSSPGQGYFSLFERQNPDWTWWRSQVAAAKAYDWSLDLRTGSSSLSDQTVRTLFKHVLENYATATSEQFSAHPLADILRNTLPNAVREWVTNPDRYITEGSPGRGVWAGVPWVAVMDRLITDTVQEGYYLAYLFDANQTGIYLSLNQGVTSVKALYGAGSSQALRARAQDMLSRLGDVTKGMQTGPIHLSSQSNSVLGALYEAGSVCSIRYAADDLPTEDILRRDFARLLLIYEDLTARDERLQVTADVEDDEVDLDIEDARKLREHKRIERNRRLSEKAKKHHGYVCKACGFDFEEKYGSIGKSFIEAHHLVPLSKLKGEVVSLSPERDFTVLCSNCHRMIHKTNAVGSVNEFRSRYLPDL